MVGRKSEMEYSGVKIPMLMNIFIQTFQSRNA